MRTIFVSLLFTLASLPSQAQQDISTGLSSVVDSILIRIQGNYVYAVESNEGTWIRGLDFLRQQLTEIQWYDLQEGDSAIVTTLICADLSKTTWTIKDQTNGTISIEKFELLKEFKEDETSRPNPVRICEYTIHRKHKPEIITLRVSDQNTLEQIAYGTIVFKPCRTERIIDKKLWKPHPALRDQILGYTEVAKIFDSLKSKCR